MISYSKGREKIQKRLPTGWQMEGNFLISDINTECWEQSDVMNEMLGWNTTFITAAFPDVLLLFPELH